MPDNESKTSSNENVGSLSHPTNDFPQGTTFLNSKEAATTLNRESVQCADTQTETSEGRVRAKQ